MPAKKVTTLIAAVCAAAVIGTSAASAQQTVVGGGLAFTDLGEFDLGFQVNAYVPIAAVPGLRVGGDFTYYLPQSETFLGESIDANFFAINGNAQYYFMAAPELALYGLGGLSFGRASFSVAGESDSDTDIGINIGIGLEFMVGFGTLYGEAKVVTGDYDRIGIAGGVRIPLQ